MENLVNSIWNVQILMLNGWKKKIECSKNDKKKIKYDFLVWKISSICIYQKS